MNTAEAAELLDISPTTLRQWAADNLVPCRIIARRGRSTYLFDRQTLSQWKIAQTSGGVASVGAGPKTTTEENHDLPLPAQSPAGGSTFLSLARRAAAELVRQRGTFTADDLRAACDAQGIRPEHYNAWGGVFGPYGAGLKWTGKFKKSTAPQGHGNLQRVWKL